MKRIFAFLSIAAIAASVSAQTPAPVSIKKSVKPSPITHDITVVGWVHGDPIQLPAQANQDLVEMLDDPINCGLQLKSWRDGQRTNIIGDTDRQYANAFLLRNSDNTAPPNTIDPVAVAAGGDFRLFNRAKVEFRVENGQIGTRRFINQDEPLVGRTPEPCSGLGVLRPEGEPHPDNGAQGGTLNGNIYKLNEGRIGEDGQKVNRTLNACSQFECGGIAHEPNTPWIWSTIKFDLQGNFITPMDKQIFPTYSIYRNKQLLDVRPQSEPDVFIQLKADSQRIVPQIQ